MNENKTTINYYPGHMAKTKRELKENIKLIDVIYELVDAKLPKSSKIKDIDELDSAKDILYKGLSEWLNNYKEALIQELHEGSAICGEWLGMGQIKYNIDDFDKRWYMFAKANVDDDFNLYNLNYNHDDFIYPFESQEIPKFIGIVPVVSELKVLPDKKHLDSLYEKYTTKVKRNVEGFVVSYRNQISKYVRMKNGKLQEHHE